MCATHVPLTSQLNDESCQAFVSRYLSSSLRKFLSGHFTTSEVLFGLLCNKNHLMDTSLVVNGVSSLSDPHFLNFFPFIGPSSESGPKHSSGMPPLL